MELTKFQKKRKNEANITNWRCQKKKIHTHTMLKEWASDCNMYDIVRWFAIIRSNAIAAKKMTKKSQRPGERKREKPQHFNHYNLYSVEKSDTIHFFKRGAFVCVCGCWYFDRSKYVMYTSASAHAHAQSSRCSEAEKNANIEIKSREKGTLAA